MLSDISSGAETVGALFANPVFLSPLVSLCAAQLTKGIIHALGGGAKRAGELVQAIVWRTGGMPSSHAAVVCSISVALALSEGLGSNMFAFSLWFAMVVLRDAMGVRMSAGLSARALNKLGRSASDKLGLDYSDVKEIQGHTPLEVVLGGLLGSFIAAGIYLV